MTNSKILLSQKVAQRLENYLKDPHNPKHNDFIQNSSYLKTHLNAQNLNNSVQLFKQEKSFLQFIDQILFKKDQEETNLEEDEDINIFFQSGLDSKILKPEALLSEKLIRMDFQNSEDQISQIFAQYDVFQKGSVSKQDLIFCYLEIVEKNKSNYYQYSFQEVSDQIEKLFGFKNSFKQRDLEVLLSRNKK